MAAQSEIEEIKARLPIDQLVGERVALRPAGRNLKGLCPFHQEKTPSFIVTPADGTYHCFGCGQHGDIFTFVQRTENVTFPEALERLAQRAGVELRQTGSADEDRRLKRLREVLELTARFWHDLLLRSERAESVRAYLRERGIDWSSVETFTLGWAPDGYTTTSTWLQERGVTLAELTALGLVVERDAERGGGHYDRFRNRLIFPIRDARGRLTGFGGRALGADDKPKYLNSSDSPLFDKRRTLYAIDQAQGGIRDAGQVVVVEGYMDALIAHQFGIKNVVASLGTALTEHQVGMLKRLTNRLVLALDADAAGSEATVRGLGVIEQVYREGVAVPTARGRIRQQAAVGADIRILMLPEGEDPDEVIRRDPAAWQALVEAALPFVDFYILHYTRNLDLEDARAVATAAATVLDKIALLADRVAQDLYVARLASKLGVSDGVLRQVLAARRAAVGAPRRGEPVPPGQPEEPAAASGRAPAVARSAGSATLAERVLALLLAHAAMPFDWGRLNPDWFESPLPRELAAELRQAGAATGDEWIEEARERLGPLLREYLDELRARTANSPRLTDYQFESEIAEAFARLEKERINRQARLHREELRREAIDLADPSVAELMASQANLYADLARLHERFGHVQDPDYSAVGGGRQP